MLYFLMSLADNIKPLGGSSDTPWTIALDTACTGTIDPHSVPTNGIDCMRDETGPSCVETKLMGAPIK